MRIIEFFIVLPPANSLLFMAFVASPLNAVSGVVVDVEDFANIAYRLQNFLIGIATIGLS